ncbi:hypothetical protein BcepSauron_032 [Burkholderia phage BcepSauron]|uniref:Uncharacterized protein n=1 Tax=Burkholderia phage BcepSauron TaxID=2530033 RepID=A0A482MMC0_9CAUD|nr:hypothetical protein H1O17_gp032 [Burkholderia phage BcepSauron]QBQ74412.1 hypothetical protein BcepSauron_032 [Burkholderia phage BcepSauron]
MDKDIWFCVIRDGSNVVRTRLVRCASGDEAGAWLGRVMFPGSAVQVRAARPGVFPDITL